MEHREGRFQGQKKLNLYYQCWLPDGDARAILLIVHGLFEHSGRYTNLVNYLVPKGYAVYGLDHRGHGKSEGLRGYVEKFSHYLEDLQTFVKIVRRGHGNSQIFLTGHSVGGTIATAYTIDHQHELTGLILSGASLMVASNISPILTALAPMVSRLLPKLGMTTIDAAAISQDQAVVDAYLNDPLVYKGRIRARLGAELIRTYQQLRPRMSWINLPVLIMHGTADRLSESDGSQLLYEQISSTDKTLKLYQDFCHEIFNEPGREQVLADIETWLAARV